MDFIVLRTIKLLNKMMKKAKISEHMVYKERIRELKSIYLLKNKKILKETKELIKDLKMDKALQNYYKNIIKEKYEVKNQMNYYKLFLILAIENVSMTEQDDFILLKYNQEVIFGDLWNKFYMESRGTVIDYKKENLVTLPYKKFFNLNEKPYVNLDIIKGYYDKGYKFIIKDKLDGSLINISKYNGQVVVTSSGSFTSSQVYKAIELLNRYKYFVDNMREDYTYMFEIIYPDNRVVVDYKDTEDIFLTGIRNKKTFTLVKDEEIKNIVQKYGLKMTSYDNRNFEQILDATKEYSYKDKEGWVIKVEEMELLFKLKCDDYINAHKYFTTSFTDKNIACLIKEEKIDDYLARLDGDRKKEVLSKVREILSKVDKTKNEVEKLYNSIPSDILVNRKILNDINTFKLEIATKNLNKLLIDYIIKGKDNTNVSEELKEEFHNKYISIFGINKRLGMMYQYVNKLNAVDIYKKLLMLYISNEDINYYEFVLDILEI